MMQMKGTGRFEGKRRYWKLNEEAEDKKRLNTSLPHEHTEESDLPLVTRYSIPYTFKRLKQHRFLIFQSFMKH